MTVSVLDGVVLFLAVGFPVYALWADRRAYARIREGDARARGAWYRATIVELWLLAALGAWAWHEHGLDLGALGLEAPSGWPFWLGLAVAVALIVAVVTQVRGLRVRPDEAARLASKMRETPGVGEVLPSEERELRGYVAVSVTAGLCEELLYRGLLMGYGELRLGLPVWATVMASSLVFGLAHASQGFRGLVRSTLAGLIFAGAYLATGSLWVPMLLHVVLDLNSGWLVRAGERW